MHNGFFFFMPIQNWCASHKIDRFLQYYKFKIEIQVDEIWMRSLLVRCQVRTVPINICRSIMVNPAFLFGSKPKPTFLAAPWTAYEFITMTRSSIVTFMRPITIFWCVIVVFKKHCFCQRHLLPFNHDPDITFPFPGTLPARMFLKSRWAQLICSKNNNKYKTINQI